MSACLVSPPSSSAHALPRLGEAVVRAVRRLSLRVLGATFAVALAFQLWLLVEIREIYPTMSVGATYLSATIINVFMSLCIMFTTLVADESVDLGTRRFPAYAWAVAIGAAAGAFAQWLAHRWLHVIPVNLDVPSANPIYDISGRLHIPAVDVTQPVVMFFEFLIWGSIIVFIYVERRSALRAAERMTAAHVARARAQRRTLESRLQALQARVEPQFLFNTLAQVRDLYDRDPAKGGRMLSDLIAYLRAALPHMRESASTLAQEIELASAYLRIAQERSDGRLALEVDVSPAANAARVPAMILLPLIDRVVDDGAPLSPEGAVRIAARVADGGLCVELSYDGHRPTAGRPGDILDDIRDRLRGLYGDHGRLGTETGPGGVTRIVMEIPDETADGDPR